MGALLTGGLVYWGRSERAVCFDRLGGRHEYRFHQHLVVRFQQSRFLDTRLWRLVFALGLILGAALWWTWLGPTVPLHTSVPLWQLGVGGVLVGFGARLGNGCTSGHGICGLSSLQLPSLVAVLTFMATGFVTANVVLFLGGR